MTDREHHLRWLASLKPGDEVCAPRNARYDRTPEILTVKRLTETQIITETGYGREQRYRRKTGVAVGSQNYTSIQPVTAEVHEQIRLHKLRTWLYDIEKSSSKIPLKVLEAVHIAYVGAMAEHQAEKAKQAGGGAA